MVVLLAIAGAVAAVLFNRASTETSRLQDQTTQTEVYSITSSILCRSSGHTWATATAMPTSAGNQAHIDGLAAAGITAVDRDGTANDGYCTP